MTQSIHTRDREKDKFDADGNIKVSIEQNNATATDQDVIVKNTASEPVPVSIVNPDSSIDLEVQVQPNITIDDSTPLDVNITNAAVSTNATIQGTANVNVTNMHLHVYDMLYDGASWVNQASDTDGRAIVLNKKYYTSADITALGSNTNVRDWLNAYADHILVYKYVSSYDDEFEAEVHFTHPDLGDGNKCLKLTFTYTTQNSQKVVEHVVASVVDWTFDSSVQGTVTLTLGTITSPDPSSAIAVGTDICTIAAATTTGGTITIALSGTNASLYTLRNVTDGTTGSSFTYDAAKSYVLETASDFSGSSYSHSTTITATESTFSFTDSQNVTTSGTFTAPPSFTNSKYVQDVYRGQVIGSTTTGNYYRDSSSDGLGFFPDLDQAAAFRNSNNVSYSWWAKRPVNPVEAAYPAFFYERYSNTSIGRQTYFSQYIYNAQIIYWTTYEGNYRRKIYNMPSDDNFHHYCITTNTADVVTGLTFYLDGSAQTPTYTQTTATMTRTGSVTDVGFGGLLLNHFAANGTTSPAPSSSANLTIDEFSTWKKTLSLSEVQEIYNSGTPADLESHSAASDLQRWFRFGDTTGDGTVIKDSQNTSFEMQSFDSQDNTTSY